MKRKYILLIIIIIIVIFLFLVFRTSYGFITNNSYIKLNGSENEILEYGNSYEENGASFYVNKKKVKTNIFITNKINLDKLGEYKVVYKVKYLGKTYTTTRKVTIVDTTSPTLELSSNEDLTVYTGEEVILPTYYANDNYDGNLNNRVETISNIDNNTAGTYTVDYKVCDLSGNCSSTSVNVIIKNKIIVSSSDENDETNYYNSPEYDEIVNYIKNNNIIASFGYYNLETGDTILYKSSKRYYACSLIKTVEAMYLYDTGQFETYKNTIKPMIEISDNYSYIKLYNITGQATLGNYAASLGAQYPFVNEEQYGFTSVDDQIKYMQHLYPIINENSELKSYFNNSFYNYLSFDSNITVLHKYGLYDANFHESGIVLDTHPYIVSVLTLESDQMEIITEISKLIYKYHLSKY